MNALKIWWASLNESAPRLWKTVIATIILVAVFAWFARDFTSWLYEGGQIGVLYKKVMLCAIALVFTYYADAALFPYARPHDLKANAEKAFAAFNDEAALALKANAEQVFVTGNDNVALAWMRSFDNACLRRVILALGVLIAFATGA